MNDIVYYNVLAMRLVCLAGLVCMTGFSLIIIVLVIFQIIPGHYSL